LRATAYRIVQEALTNVLRHARASSVTVRVRAEGDAVELEVRDDGTGAGGSGGAGHGLGGMRERAAALGGTAESGPAPDGGWVVRARLPTRVVTTA
jgi:signal transduction histidine kinase